MGALVYFVAKRDAINAEGVRALGLGYMLNGGGVAVTPTAASPSSPGGMKGVYFSASKFKVGALVFEPLPGKDGIWIGIDPAHPPGPKDLARKEQLSGHRVEMGDGFPGKVTAFRPEMAVHGKYGKPCPACGTSVLRIRYASNETNYCPRCQTGGKLLADRALSRLLKKDWPRSIEELERLGLYKKGERPL